MSNFKDHFSARAADYRRFRPAYPGGLFRYLAKVAPDTSAAWDCATGSGQAAVGLARHFREVIATDASDAQIARAQPYPRVRYQVAAGESSGLGDASVSLVTVAQALHWLDLGRFYREVGRGLRPRGVLAAWTYNLLNVCPEVDAVVRHLYGEILRPHWPAERRLVEDGYRGLPFPFTEIAAPPFRMNARWDLHQLLGYLGTWSAVKRFEERETRDPLGSTRPELGRAWGDPRQRREVSWPVALRVGTIEG